MSVQALHWSGLVLWQSESTVQVPASGGVVTPPSLQNVMPLMQVNAVLDALSQVGRKVAPPAQHFSFSAPPQALSGMQHTSSGEVQSEVAGPMCPIPGEQLPTPVQVPPIDPQVGV